MKIFNYSKKIAYFNIIESLTDMYYSREIVFFLVLFLSAMSYKSYVSQQEFFTSVSAPFINANAVVNFSAIAFFISVIVYSGTVTGSLGNMFKRGSLGFLFSMPINRFIFYILVYTVSVLLSSALFFAAVLIIMYITSSAIFLHMALFYLLAIFSTMCFYVSIGIFISVIFRNGIISFIAVSIGFFTAMVYAHKIMPHIMMVQYFLRGITFLSNFPTKNDDILLPALYMIFGSIFIVIISYYIAKNRNMRSGRVV